MYINKIGIISVSVVVFQAQYRLVHEAALEAYTCRNCRIPVTSLGTVLTSTVDAKEDNEYIDKEFQVGYKV